MTLYRCTVQFRQDSMRRSRVEMFTVEAESIREAAEEVRDRFPLRSKGGHQGFKIEEVRSDDIRSL